MKVSKSTVSYTVNHAKEENGFGHSGGNGRKKAIGGNIKEKNYATSQK